MRKTILLSGMLMRSLIRRPKWPICLAACAAIVLACYWGKHITEPALAVHMTAYGQLLLTLVLLLFGLQIESEPGRIFPHGDNQRVFPPDAHLFAVQMAGGDAG